MNENIIIPNPENLKKTLNLIINDGPDQIHVLSDFDKTLTKAFVNGQIFPSIISELRNGGVLGDEYAKKANELYSFYHPIEIDPEITFQEKFEKMTERRNKHIKLLINSKLNKKNIEEVVKNGNVKLREGGSDFFGILNEKNIPLVIISASGLGESIEIFLEHEKKLTKNIEIITNYFIRDEKGYAIGHKNPIIHTLNKSEIILDQFPFYEKVKDRKNVILLGDTIEDTWMIDGFEYKNLIKIGFLNENIEKQIEFFKKKYDVIIPNDGNMDYVNKILEQINK